MKTYEVTNIGKRTTNEDQVAIITKNDQQMIALVCDGMGGHNSGELASKIVCEYICDCFRIMPVFRNDGEASGWLSEVVKDANRLTKRQSLTSPAHQGMGTTLVLALIYQKQVYIASVGDSRAYRIDDQEIVQLTEDDTFVNELIKSNIITKEEAKNHPKRNVLMKAMGVSEDIEVEVQTYPLQVGYLLLCSDGLYNGENEKQIQNVVLQSCSLKEKCDRLVDEAIENGSRDNISIALIEIEGRDLSELE